MLGINVPIKYLARLKNCTSLTFSTKFEESEDEIVAVLNNWNPTKKFEKFVVQVKKIPTCFINFISVGFESISDSVKLQQGFRNLWRRIQFSPSL